MSEKGLAFCRTLIIKIELLVKPLMIFLFPLKVLQYLNRLVIYQGLISILIIKLHV